MRKKKILKREVYTHPDRIYQVQHQAEDFASWLEQKKGGKELFLELGMGTGDFLLSKAKNDPHGFYLGIEVKADRIMKAFKKSDGAEVKNLAFLRTGIEHLRRLSLPKAAGIYILFPDPWPKKKHGRRRLTSPTFLKLYKHLLSKNGYLILKTDDRSLFDYSIESFEQADWRLTDVIRGFVSPPEEQTAYEKKFLSQGKSISYLKAYPKEMADIVSTVSCLLQ